VTQQAAEQETENPPRRLVVKVTCGAEDAERCNQAFTVSAAAVAAGAEVSLWLTGEAAWFAVPGRAAEFELPLAAPLADLLAAVLAGGQVTLCTQCAQRRGLTADSVIDGIRIAGAAGFAEEVLAEGARALVY
jgi:predicted peroxiredoxin